MTVYILVTRTYFILGPKNNTLPAAEISESQTLCDNNASDNPTVHENNRNTSCSGVVINENHNTSQDEYTSHKVR